jgi:hypothetical protein
MSVLVNLTVGSLSTPYYVASYSPLLFLQDGILLDPEFIWNHFLYRYWQHGAGHTLGKCYKSRGRFLSDYTYGSSTSPITPTEFLKFCLVHCKRGQSIATHSLYEILTSWSSSEIIGLPSLMIRSPPTSVAIDIKLPIVYTGPYRPVPLEEPHHTIVDMV